MAREALASQPSAQPWIASLNAELDDYKANFADIRPIVEQFAMVAPYAADDDGERLDVQPNAITRLYDPNDEMGFYDFADYLASSVLSQSRALVRVVWRKNKSGRELRHISANIDGYIFLPPSSRQVMGDGAVRYQYTGDDGVTEIATRTDVMEFYYSMATDAYGVGVSPAQASKKWATIEDYAAAYQAGFFQNGAKPDGMFVVTANSYEQYQQAVEALEKIHRRGSRGHWRYQYSYRPTDENGDPLRTSSVEWVSFGSSNKDLDLSGILSNTQERKDSAYGVPAIARGNDATATYNNAQVSDRNLARKVDYLLRRIWARYQHELARVCEDSIDWHISYDYEVPALADADEIAAETDKTRVDSLIALMQAGATAGQAIEALGLGNRWDALRGMIAANMRTPLASVNGGGGATTTGGEQSLKARTVTKVAGVVKANNWRVVEALRISANAEGESDEEQDERLEQDLREALSPLGVAAAMALIALLKRQNKLMKRGAVVTALDAPEWLERLENVAKTHNYWIRSRASRTLERASEENWSDEKLNEALSDIVAGDAVEGFAENEVENSERWGQLQGAYEIAKVNGLRGYKTWVTAEDDRVCEFCRAMDGKRVPLGEAWLNEGDSVTNSEGVEFFQDFGDLDVPDAHNHCRCAFALDFESIESEGGGAPTTGGEQ